MKQVKILGRTIKYSDKNVKIVNSYLTKDDFIMEYILKKFIEGTDYKSKRSIKSWIKEWKTHNRLYKLGLFRTHTKDCDLEQDESKFRLFFYNIFGIF